MQALKDGEEDYGEMLVEAKKRQNALALYEKTVPARQQQWEVTFAQKPEWQAAEIVTIEGQKRRHDD